MIESQIIQNLRHYVNDAGNNKFLKYLVISILKYDEV